MPVPLPVRARVNGAPMSDTIAKAALFETLGYGGSHELLDQRLEAGGLSRASRPNISAAKAERVSALLAAHFVAVCARGDCQAVAADDERIIVAAASAAHCSVCHGSSNARAVDELVAALHAAGMRKLCVVGGSPTSHTALAQLLAGRIELRLIDGTGSRTAAQARADLAWADVVAIWGSTMLNHKVSLLYRGAHVIQMARRSIRDLAAEVTAGISGNDHTRRGFRR
jgi:hypothetical protein